MKIGNIEFPEGFGYKFLEGAKMLPEENLQGFEFFAPLLSTGLIIMNPDIDAAAQEAYTWFVEKGHITPKKYRLVAYIYPKESWGIQDDETERRRVASRTDAENPNYGLNVERTGPPRDDPRGLMIYSMGDFYLPDGGNLQSWQRCHNALTEAMQLPILHREDFTYISELD